MAAEFNVASVVKYLLVIETKRILCWQLVTTRILFGLNEWHKAFIFSLSETRY